MNFFGISLVDITNEWMNALAHFKNRQVEFDLWKQQNGYKRMNKKRWEQWFQQNLK